MSPPFPKISRLALVPVLTGILFTGPAAAVPDAVTAAWPGFRGPNGDGSVPGAVLFPGSTASLEVNWKVEIGSGYSALAVGKEGVIALFASGSDDVAAAFDPDTGKERWRTRIADTYAGHDGSHDGPISTPLLSGGRVYGLAPRGELFCLDADTGQEIWKTHLVSDHGAKKPHYGFTASPVLMDGVLVVPLGGEKGKAVGGFSATDGSLVWTMGEDEYNYQSPVAATLAGRRLVLSVGKTNLYGLDPRTGEALFSYQHDGDDRAMGGHTIVPLVLGDGRVFVMNKLESSVMLQVSATGEVTELWTTRGLKQTYVPPVHHDGYIYGMSNRVFTCIDASNGEIAWRSREPGDGFPTLVGKHLLMMTKPGSFHLADASSEGYHEIAHIDLFPDHSWSEVAHADGHLFARSMRHLARVDVTTSKGGETPVTRAPGASGDFARFQAEVAAASDKAAVVDAFLASQGSFPIIGRGGNVHFVYRGEAEDVGIVGDMIGYRREEPMTRIEGTDLFHYTMTLEPDAAVTYGFIVDYETPVADPLNPRPGKGLFGEVSWFSMPSRLAPESVAEAPADRQGALLPLEWTSALLEGKVRKAQVYLPAGFDENGARRYPVLYVLSGKEALEEGLMKNALDHAIGHTVEPLIAVFPMPDEDPQAERVEPEKLVSTLSTELVPFVDGKYPTIAEPWARGAVGAAGTGEMALQCVLRQPELFGRVGSQFATVMRASDLEEAINLAGDRKPVMYLQWGTYHLRSPHEAWDMARANRDLWTLLREHGFRPAGGEVPEGFAWACWRGHTENMLRALYPLR